MISSIHAFLQYLGGRKMKKKKKKRAQEANIPLHLQGFLGHQNPRRKLPVHYKQLLRVCVGVSLREQEIDMEVCLLEMGAENKRWETDER